MKRIILSFCVCATVLCGCGNKESAPASASDANAGTGANPMDAPAGYLGGISKAKTTAVKTVDIASVQNAINLFNAQEDRYPKSLDELVQKRYIAALPAPPYGQKYTYDATKGQVKIVAE